jgi:hypothetical protein
MPEITGVEPRQVIIIRLSDDLVPRGWPALVLLVPDDVDFTVLLGKRCQHVRSFISAAIVDHDES